MFLVERVHEHKPWQKPTTKRTATRFWCPKHKSQFRFAQTFLKGYRSDGHMHQVYRCTQCVSEAKQSVERAQFRWVEGMSIWAGLMKAGEKRR